MKWLLLLLLLFSVSATSADTKQILCHWQICNVDSFPIICEKPNHGTLKRMLTYAESLHKPGEVFNSECHRSNEKPSLSWERQGILWPSSK